ncbi:4-hydroxy-3-methylbut-2-enyl diphosphate reductase [Desulfothermus okinawensis JCM 13304]
MNIIRGKRAGFCMGVGLALKKLDEAIKRYPLKKIYTLGPIIHNPQVVDIYLRKGVVPIEDVSSIGPDDVVVIRAHGVPKQLYKQLQEKGAKIIDATCPKVKKAQRLIEQYSLERILLLFGEKEHPEVKGLLSHALCKGIVFSSIEELKSISLDLDKNYFLASQTTQERQEFIEIVSFLKNRFGKDFPILDTICDATRLRQEEAIEIAKNSDVVIVIGGYNSGNTRRLLQVVRATRTECYHIETIHDISREMIEGKNIIGLTAGASTPEFIIEQVEKYLESF